MMVEKSIGEIVDKAIEILSRYPLCDYCLGRQFARLGYGMNNKQRGEALKTIIAMALHRLIDEGQADIQRLKIIAENGSITPLIPLIEKRTGEKIKTKECTLCGNQLSEVRFNELAHKIYQDLTQYEFRTFLVGASIPAEIREMEDKIRSEFSIDTGEDIKNDITRSIGRVISTLSNTKVEYACPDITVIVDFFNDSYQIQVNPLFIRGVYLKHKRNIPQTVWLCRVCWGKGCEACNYKGREYETSISELIGIPATEYFEALDFKFHAAGREDVDALMEGTGRPFVLELKHPRKRFLDLKKLEEIINKRAEETIEVRELRPSSRREIREIKAQSTRTSKTYLAEVFFNQDIEPEKLKEIEEKFKDITVEQRTPTRVLRRRGDKIRHKHLYEVKILEHEGRRVVFRIKAQGGLYVKELIDGDNDRTNPNIAGYLGITPEKILLSVIEVEE